MNSDLEAIYHVATDGELAILDRMAERAGVLVRCGCGWMIHHTEDRCGDCGAPVDWPDQDGTARGSDHIYPYIDPADATKLRVFPEWDNEWSIDATDGQGGYTEQVWSGYDSPEAAAEVAEQFAEAYAPHLAGTEPERARA